MEMNRDRERFLISLIDQLLSTEGTEWAREEVSDILRRVTGIPDSSAYGLIQKVDRYCIEEVCRQQAVELYSFFPDMAIGKQLEEDFLAMEHERRRNNFSNFSLHCYQQIECIVNHLFEQEWIGNALKMHSGKKAYIKVSYSKYDPVTDTRPDDIIYRGGTTISKAIFPYGSKNKLDTSGLPLKGLDDNKRPYWDARSKMRLVSYFAVFGASVKQEEFELLLQWLDSLYTARNTNHRPVTNTTMLTQEKYLEFSGTLAWFIQGIKNNISLLSTGLQELAYELIPAPVFNRT